MYCRSSTSMNVEEATGLCGTGSGGVMMLASRSQESFYNESYKVILKSWLSPLLKS